MPLDSKTNKFNIVVDFPYGCDIDSLKTKLFEFLPSYFSEYSAIFHDKDINDVGIQKTPHTHIVAKSNSRIRLCTVINAISNVLECSPFLISCKKCVSYVGSIQYLVHKNDKDKYQYNVDEIYTSLPRDELELIINSDNESISLDRLINIVKNAKNLADIMREIGLSNYIGYRNVIKDLWQERMFL